ncbi:MAG: efflux RND transporter periplasmic adaptor subunit [Methylococcales bacterium]|nr:efflux RND transporter periplasmic adaptor subunit [Methylococcales bacterium]
MPKSDKQTDIEQALELNTPVKYSYRKWMIVALVLIVFSAVAIKMLFFSNSEETTAQFETVPIKQGDLTIIVTATGKLEPVTQVDIGIEVSGTAAEINADFNDHVQAGQVLAKLDPRLFDARVKQSQGALDQAKAKLIDAEATIVEKKQVLDFLLQARQMSGGKLPAKQEMVTAEANLKRAQAQAGVINGTIKQAEGQLKLDETNLIKSSIKTPITGIVLDRQIEKGQTVAASLQTPIMFTVAENLTEMELHVDVDEADVGKIKLEQPASFSVDAYPDKNFPAKISEIRYAPQTVGGVVTYETVLLVNNADSLLRPGMTATADMTVSQAKNVLLVPNTALRFNPTQNGDAAKKELSFVEKLIPGPPRANKPKKVRENKSLQKPAPQIWVLENNQPKAVAVQVGLTDGEVSEVSAPQLSVELPVIVDTLGAVK